MPSLNHRVSLVVSVLNEAHTIRSLLQALARQTVLPQEVIIVDGGSTDNTLQQIQGWQAKHQPKSKSFKLQVKQLDQANRSQARNWGITQAKHNLIAITDAGCIPQPSWLENLLKTYQKTQADIVAGYFYGLPKTAFEQAVVSYTLEMPGRVNPDKFMPTTRSVLLQKSAWEKLGGFDENLSLNEDFVFFHQAQQQNFKIAFARNALVGWLPRQTLSEFAKMIFKFAQGDTYAGIVRARVKLLFARYSLALVFLLDLIFIHQASLSKITLTYTALLLFYFVWAISKNIRYAPQGWYWLPVLQLMADVSVMAGSLVGWLRRWRSN
jgi:glycosyltransferase involved in cell wall biosynthesis